MEKVFTAASAGDLAIVKTYIEDGFDINTKSQYGFTLLQTVALGTNLLEAEEILPVLEYLIEAGSDLELKSNDERTALYLVAEFSKSIQPVQLLLDKGANPNIKDSSGNHIVKNALLTETQQLLSQRTGVPIPTPKPTLKQVKMKGSQWTKAKKEIKKVFDALSMSGLISLQDSGYTQQNGFEDCSEIYHDHPVPESVKGFCFYTRQDQNTAKRTSVLYLGFWGAPEGQDEATIAVGELIVESFKHAGFECHWNKTAGQRPAVFLYPFSEE